MSSPWPAVALIVGIVMAAEASAQTPGPTPARPAPTLDGLTVAPSPPPSVVSSFPAAGSNIDPGVMVLKLTFDQRMDPDTWGYAKAAAGDYPDCLAKPRLLDGARTFVLLCTTAPGKAYSILINPGENAGFANPGGRKAAPFELNFSTAPRGVVSSLQEALKVAGLREEDGPILNAEPARR